MKYRKPKTTMNGAFTACLIFFSESTTQGKDSWMVALHRPGILEGMHLLHRKARF